MEVSQLPLPPSMVEMLHLAGFSVVADLDGISALELADELKMSPSDASQLLASVRSHGLRTPRAPPATSALELLHDERHSEKIVTAVKELDDLLGGGIPLRQLTELVGVPGVGKTQLSIQLALTVQIPRLFHGAEGEAVYIDTEGSFMAERAHAMAEALLRHLHATAHRAADHAQAAAAASLRASHLLERIHCFRVHDAAELLATVRSLNFFLAERKTVKLVVVDSVAFHFRHGVSDYTRRHQMLGQLTQALSEYATRHSLSVVMVNQVTTKVNDATNTSSIQPALGESWAHACNIQLVLHWMNGTRVARLCKGREPGWAEYQVTEEGVRSVQNPTRGADT
ncbi:hypothetical protein AB1Y20_021582 [Prymnesium parvum]|uniref:DNA repair protein RAD51 homolog 3 n=1 Tax=Prymnesium parvum TaxID=97485 RepID=A0AB34JML5_PRYPA